MGISRSSTVILAYLIKYCNMNLKLAYSFLMENRPCAYPNDGFLKQLNIFNKQINPDDEIFTR
jgi:protein-tyrosine phosphatase